MKLGGGQIKYALIGLGIYSFHYDLSQSVYSFCRIPQYLIAFNDLHNFYMPLEEYRKFFRPEYLNKKVPPEAEMDCITNLGKGLHHIDRRKQIGLRKKLMYGKIKIIPKRAKKM